MGLVSRVTFIYIVHVGHSTLMDHGWRPESHGAQGPAVDVCRIDGGHSWISVNTRQGPPSMFIALMVDAFGSPLVFSRGPVVDIS
jgi:hypothetical protein